jgi:hypothetical protein
VPIADATPGINKFAVDTASTLQCTFGPGLPNNRLIIKKTPEAIIVSSMRVKFRLLPNDTQRSRTMGGDSFACLCSFALGAG